MKQKDQTTMKLHLHLVAAFIITLKHLITKIFIASTNVKITQKCSL